MPGSQSGGIGRKTSAPQLTRIRGREYMRSSSDVSDHEAAVETDDHANGFSRHQNESPSSRLSFSSSLNQKTPARSYFQHSFQDSHGEIQLTQTPRSVVY